MADYLIFDSNTDAVESQIIVWQEYVAEAVSDGYTGDVDSGIVGRLNGVDYPEGARTLRWDTPVLTLQNKWVVAHPMVIVEKLKAEKAKKDKPDKNAEEDKEFKELEEEIAKEEKALDKLIKKLEEKDTIVEGDNDGSWFTEWP